LWSVGLWSSVICFVCSLFLWINFDYAVSDYQYVVNVEWFDVIKFILGVDGISLFFILLTTFLVCLCLFSSVYSVKSKVKEFIICFLIMEAFILCVFSFIDLLFFYIFFESVLIPMFVLISLWGSRSRKIRAGYLFFMFTLVGSLLMLFGIVYI
jgi:NADH-quinone oxidoreductase subunit M